MDTTLEDRKITWLHIFLYALVSELAPIVANILYVYVWGNLINPDLNLSFTHEYMTQVGVFIFMCVGFLSHTGTAIWIAKPSRVRTIFNGARMLLVIIALEIIFYYLVGLEFRIHYAFSFLVYAIGFIVAAITPPILKGRRTHLKDWDKHKDEEYHKTKRK